MSGFQEYTMRTPQVVHSRTFANAARTGGVGVRMLVPLVDMINHAGDTTASGSMDDPNIVPTDNVRWVQCHSTHVFVYGGGYDCLRIHGRPKHYAHRNCEVGAVP